MVTHTDEVDKRIDTTYGDTLWPHGQYMVTHTDEVDKRIDTIYGDPRWPHGQ